MIHMDEEIIQYAAASVKTRTAAAVEQGVSPRAVLALVQMAKPMLSGQANHHTQDIKDVFVDVCGHRLIFDSQSEDSQRNRRKILQAILQEIKPPAILERKANNAAKQSVYGLLLLAMAVIYIFTNTYYTLTLLASVCFCLFPLALMLLSHRGLSISLQAPAAADKEEAVFTYQFENASRLPVARLGFQVQLENQMSGSQKTRKVSTTVGGKTSKRKISYQRQQSRNCNHFDKEICIYDAFGLFTLKTDLPDQATMIYPHMREAAVHMEKAIETTGDGRRYSTDKTGSGRERSFCLREYAPGDEVKNPLEIVF